MHSGTNHVTTNSTHRNWQGRRSEGEIALLLQKTDAVVHANVSTRPAAYFAPKKMDSCMSFKTLGADDNVRSMARDLLDSDLLTRIEGVGDLIALEAKYHLACLVGLRNRHRSLIRNRENLQDARKPDKKARARAFAELVTYIENEVEEGTLLFKFASLRHLYESRLADFGIRS
ncbi:hypothetical protein GWK47_044567 [Chionoecetes opilio]|uniref:Uncharacterized protein n=2 Tax=Chionoecetes opilio TaxID=41210 RepID=A0A8J4Y741_CHIOP|nr:hypothetical protein GWK47_044567 [Chionoecetes opilio]